MSRAVATNRSWILDAIGILAVIGMLLGLAPSIALTTVSAEGVDDGAIADSVIDDGYPNLSDYTIAVDPAATHAIGNRHSFTVSLTSVGVPVAGALIGLRWDGAGEGITAVGGVDAGGVDATVCDTDAAGQCAVTVSSETPGTGALTATFLTPYLDAVLAPVPTAATNGQPISEIEDSATSAWVGYLVEILSDSSNLVGHEQVFTATVHETTGGGSATLAEGVQVELAWDGPAGSTIDTTTCTTNASGSCDFVVNSAIPGSGELSVARLTGLVGDGEELTVEFAASEVFATKTWFEYRATIDGDAVNPTGEDHVFAVLVERYDGTGWRPAGSGIMVEWSSTGAGDDDLAASTCDDGTDANGECTIVVGSDVSGIRTVTLETISGDFAGGGGSQTTYIEIAGEATKTWVSYELELTPIEAFNLLSGQDDDAERFHTITAILTSDDAVNAPVGGQDVDVALTGNVGTITAVEAGSVAGDGLSAVCTTDADGTCDITIFADMPGTATMSGVYEVAVGESDPFDIMSNDAVKYWTTYRVAVETDAENLVGNAHEFIVTVEQLNGDGTSTPVVGAVPAVTVTGTGVTVDTTDCDGGTDAAGTCSVIVNSDTVQSISLAAEYEAALGEITASFGDEGGKTWIDYDIDVTPDTDNNLVDTDHVFTVTITKTTPGEAGPVTESVVGARPTTILDGAGAIIGNDCGQNGTDANGQCTVTISSATTGRSTLSASWVGTAAGSAAEGDEESREYSDTADKLWWDYQLTIDPKEAINAVGDAHTFTATLLVDTGAGFQPASGEVVAVVLGGDTGALVSETCSTGTDADGQCTIVINADGPGTTTVGVSYDAVVGATSGTFSDEGKKWWTAIDLVKVAIEGDGAADGDLSFEDGRFLLSLTQSDPGPKTAVYVYTITNTGPVTLQDIVLTDDRLGTILDGSEGVVLAPGESTVVRASEQFSLSDLPGDLLAGDAVEVTNIGTVTGHPVDDPEVTVSDDDDASVALITVQSGGVADVALTKRVVLSDEDPRSDLERDLDRSDSDIDGDPFGVIGAGTWSSEETRAKAPKTLVFEFVITNTGSATLYMPVLTDVMDLDTSLLADGTPATSVVILDGTEGIILAPGQSHTERTAVTYTPEQFFNADEYARIIALTGTGAGFAKDHRDVATVTTTLRSGAPGPSDSDDAVVGMQAVLPQGTVPIGTPGLGNAGRLLPLALLLSFVGAAVLLLDRRRAFSQ